MVWPARFHTQISISSENPVRADTHGKEQIRTENARLCSWTYLYHAKEMPKSVELKDGAKTHLEGLSSEIKDLIGHATPKSKGLPMACWTANSKDVDVALTVLQAVSVQCCRESCVRTCPTLSPWCREHCCSRYAVYCLQIVHVLLGVPECSPLPPFKSVLYRLYSAAVQCTDSPHTPNRGLVLVVRAGPA